MAMGLQKMHLILSAVVPMRNLVITTADAVADDGTCTYADAGFDCDGVCLADMDADGVCDEFEVAGCQDAEACNYDANATDEDGSCFSGDGGTFCYGNYSHYGEHGI